VIKKADYHDGKQYAEKHTDFARFDNPSENDNCLQVGKKTAWNLARCSIKKHKKGRCF
jgi:protein involved in temperature-dependent protein secretion